VSPDTGLEEGSGNVAGGDMDALNRVPITPLSIPDFFNVPAGTLGIFLGKFK
jgi:hypothetical protein